MEISSLVRALGSPGEPFLSPRSKVAKMLEDIDNASTPSPPCLPAKPLNEDAIAQSAADTLQQSVGSDRLISKASAENMPSHPATDTDDSDGDIRRPQGRAARRMLGMHKSSINSSPEIRSNGRSDDEDDLYSSTPMKRRERGEDDKASPALDEVSNGLFISPYKSVHHNDDEVEGDQDEDLPANPLGSKEKLAELVAQKRAERLAREAEDAERRAQTSSDLPDDAFENDHDVPADPDVERIMSDASRPARKASKKALLEMERETQRLARQQALAHQMKVKKKFTTEDLFAKFNFRQPAAAKDVSITQPIDEDTTASSAPGSDGAEERAKPLHSTPPSSPPTPLDRQKALVEHGALSKLFPVRQDSIASLADVNEDEDLPDLEEVLRRSQAQKTAQPSITQSAVDKKGLKLARLGKHAARNASDDSDDELEIVDQLPRHLQAFNRAMASVRPNRPADSKAIHNLKHLSHLHSSENKMVKKGPRPSLNPTTLENQLRKRAKEQARQQQLERIDELRAKGIEVQTSEQREQEAEAFENLLDKARQEAANLRKAEKAARKEAGEEGAMQDSEDEDEDFELSGSEDEDGNYGDNEPDREENELVDEAAEETEDDEAEEEGDVEGDQDESDADEAVEQANRDELADLALRNGLNQSEELNDDLNTEGRKPRKSRVIIDDEDEEEAQQEDETDEPDQVKDNADPFAAFNFGEANNIALLSPTQAFNATMQTPTQATQEDSFDILRRIAPMSASSMPRALPDFDSQNNDSASPGFVEGSQVSESQRVDLNWETQPPETPVPAALNRGPSALSETPGWEPTQDPGFPSPWSVRPKASRENEVDSLAEHDTQSTVQLRVSESPAPSHNVPKRGRLQYRRVPLMDDSDDGSLPPVSSVKPNKRDAFREMARRRKEALTAAERTEADKEMRQMMDEQAEESEDEYAGLGGDDVVAPETEQDREMIDSSHIDVDERALAAHFAQRQRQKDEEETSRLYRDLTTGVLRRKMGANAFDLDEDEDELAARRRQMRQREEARKRKALLKDENVATLAEGKQSRGKDAFLKAIADDDGDDELVKLSDEEEEESAPAIQHGGLQSQSQQKPTAPLRETSGNKRRLIEGEADSHDRPPAKQRRTEASAFKRPTSLLEVQESVSFLLEEPHMGAAFAPSALDFSSDSEKEGQDSDKEDDQLSEGDEENDEVATEESRQNHGGYAPNPMSMEAKSMPPPRLPATQRRTAHKPEVIDRLSLKRGSSSSNSALGRTAWAAGPTTGGFKVPSLLRRATTNTASIANDRGVSTTTLSRENSGVKMGGSKKSSLAYQARAEERRAIVEASAKRREQNTAKIAQLRRNSSMLSRGLTGRFE